MTENDQVRKDFFAALARLRSGIPRHPDNVLALNAGKLKITPSSVAVEAGRSRTLIGMEGCKYPDVRREVLASKDQSQLQIKRSAAIKELAKEVSRLKDVIRQRDSALAAAMLQMDDLERRLQEIQPTGANVVSINQSKKSS